MGGGGGEGKGGGKGECFDYSFNVLQYRTAS